VGCILSSSSNETLAQEVSEKQKTKSSSLISDDVRRHSSSGIALKGRRRRLEGGATKPRFHLTLITHQPRVWAHVWMIRRGYTTAKSDPIKKSMPRPPRCGRGTVTRACAPRRVRVRVDAHSIFWQQKTERPPNQKYDRSLTETRAIFATRTETFPSVESPPTSGFARRRRSAQFVSAAHVPKPPWAARECPRRSSRLSAR